MVTIRRRPVRACARAAALALAASLLLAEAAISPRGWGTASAQQTSNVTLEGLRFGESPLVYRVPRAEFRGTPLARAELEALLSGASSVALAARISSLTAREIVIPEIVSEVETAQGRQITSYKDVVFTNVAGGRIGSVTAGSGTFGAATGSGAGEGGFGRFSIEDIDLGLALSLFTDKAGATAGSAAALKRLYGAFSLENLVLRGKDGVTSRIARFGGRDFSARPIREGWMGVLEILGRHPDLAAAPPDDRRRAFAMMAELFDAFEIGLIEMTGLEFSSGKEVNGAGRIGRVAFAGGGGGRSGEVQVEGIDISTGDGKVRIGNVAFGAMSLKPFFEGMQDMASASPEEMTAAEMRKLLPLVGNLRMSGLDIDLPGTPDSAGRAERVRFLLGGFEITAEKPLDGTPTDLRLALRNIAFGVPPDSGNDAAKQLRSLGYEKVDLSMAASLGWNAAGQELLLRDFSVNGVDMGGVTLKAVLGNVTKDAFNPDTAIAAVALLGATARSLELSVDNRGLADRIFGRDARASGRPVEELRREYGSMAMLGIPLVLGNSASAKTIGHAVARFIAKPGRLTIQARAKGPEGVGLADVAASADPTAILDKLDVTAVAE